MNWALGIVYFLRAYFQVPFKAFLLPGKQVKPEVIRGIPGKLAIVQDGDQPNSIPYNPLPDEEETYDLEHLRYPFKVQLMEDLPKRMVNQLEGFIEGKFVSTSLRHHWNLWKSKASRRSFRNKYEVNNIMKNTWCMVGEIFSNIRRNDACWLDFTETRDGRAKADVHMRIQSSGEIAILATAIDPRIAEEYTSKLVQLASGELQSGFEGELPDRFVGHEAILAKLSYEIMEDWGRGPRWAMIYGGNLYIIYLVVPVLVGDIKRCSFISSGVLSIDDTERPHLALMLYMMISSRMSWEDLMRTLGANVPPGSTLASLKEPDRIVTEDDRADSTLLDLSVLLTTQRICLATSRGPSTEVFLDRLLDENMNDHGPQSESPKFLLRPIGTGSISTVYRSNGAIVKVSGLKHGADLENEARVYKHLKQTNAAKFIPTFYGYFGNKHTPVLILSDEGPVVEDLRDLSPKIRNDFFNALVEIHKAGVVHKNFNSSHVFLNDSGPILFDFSHASLGHVCPGAYICDELFHSRRMLFWGESDLLGAQTLSV